MNNDTLLASHPIEIYLACDKLFANKTWLDWEPESLLVQLRKDVSEAAEDKLLAVHALAANANPVCSMAMAFEKVTHAFNNNVCVMDAWQPPFVEEITYAVPQMVKIIKAVHGADTQVTFTGEVPGYVASVAKYRGWLSLPRRLAFAENLLMHLNGVTEKSPAYLENKELVDTARTIYRDLKTPTARALLNAPEFKALNEIEQIQFLKIAGALLFDPTVLYKR